MAAQSIRALILSGDVAKVLMLRRQLRRIHLRPLDISRVGTLEDAMALLSDRKYDIVLMDLKSVEDGAEAVRRVQSRAPVTPIVSLAAGDAGGAEIDGPAANGESVFLVGENDAKALARAVHRAVAPNENEARLRESEDSFRVACESSFAMVYEFDASSGSGIFVHGLPLLLGYSLEEASQSMEWWQAQIHPDDVDGFHREMQISRASGASYRLRYRARHKDGTYRVVEDEGRQVVDERGRVVRTVGRAADVTRRMNAEAALRRSERRYHRFVEELERKVAQRTRDLDRRGGQIRLLAAELAAAEERERKRLAQGIHDDLQQLLVGGKFCAERLSGEVREDMRETVDRLNRFLNEAIESTRSLAFELSPPVLHDSGLAQALQYLKQRMEAKYGLRVRVCAEDPVEPESEDIKALLFQVTRELLFNVVKHAGVKQAEVEMRRFGRHGIQITVTDAGAGFLPEEDEAKGGSGGYGIFSIRGRLELIGGKLDIRSAPGTGCRCTVTAPLTAAPFRPLASCPSGTTADSRSILRRGMLRAAPKIRVLIADDRVLMRQGLVRLLQGYRDIAVICEAAEEREMMDLVRARRPDVVLMDSNNPRFHCAELLSRLEKEFPRLRIIGLFSSEGAAPAGAWSSAGGNAFLNRSNRLDALIATIRDRRTGIA